MGAFHSAEIAYVFHNTHRPGRAWEETDHQLSDIMSSYWVNFATTGDPNGKGLLRWPAFDEKKSDRPLVLGDKIEVGVAPNQSRLAFYQAMYDLQRK